MHPLLVDRRRGRGARRIPREAFWVDRAGTRWWYRPLDPLRVPHRVGAPAREDADGLVAWYHDGELHRADGPAVIGPNGGAVWYQHGERHREGGPAVERTSGPDEWWWHGDGPYSRRQFERLSVRFTRLGLPIPHALSCLPR